MSQISLKRMIWSFSTPTLWKSRSTIILNPMKTCILIQVVKHGVPLDLFDSGILEPRMTKNDIPGLISLLSGHDRVWLVYSHDSYTDPMGLIPQTLASQMKLIRQRDFYGGQVQLYGTP